jgi:hypothetical protein
MADITNVKVGVCSVTLNSVDLGHTQGGVEVSYEPEYQEVAVDLYGSTPVEKVLIGEKLTAKVPLAESTIANFRNAIPQATFAGAGNARITIGAKAGKKSTDDAVELVLHPVGEGTRAFDVVFYKAIVTDTVVINHVNDAEKILEVTFSALLDESKSDGNYLGLIGDSTA